MKNLHREIGQNIKKIRMEKCLKRSYLAEKLNIPLLFFIDVEDGLDNITISKLSQLAKILDISLETLICPEEANLPIYQFTASALEQQIKATEAERKILLRKIIEAYEELEEKSKHRLTKFKKES